jgi:alpha-galactosidase
VSGYVDVDEVVDEGVDRGVECVLVDDSWFTV